jgi:formyltetrahydrofolate-dependent phosphoribosylglycinamide formyltransferase
VPDVATPPRARVVVLLSGTGSLCAALLAAADDAAYPAQVVAVGADRDAPGLEHARRRGLPTFVRPLRRGDDRAAWDRALAADLAAHEPDLVVSAGFMRIVGPAVLDRFEGRLVNTHPALLPAFPGAHAVRDALAAGAGVTGATVHLVDAGVDTGPVLAQREVAVEPGDDEAALHERIKTVERDLLVQTVADLVTGRLPARSAHPSPSGPGSDECADLADGEPAPPTAQENR